MNAKSAYGVGSVRGASRGANRRGAVGGPSCCRRRSLRGLLERGNGRDQGAIDSTKGPPLRVILELLVQHRHEFGARFQEGFCGVFVAHGSTSVVWTNSGTRTESQGVTAQLPNFFGE
jgi:hypothetical protein